MGRDQDRFRKKRDNRTFTMLEGYMQRSAAWRDLGPVAKALYVELKRHYNGSNNGSIVLGVRTAGQALNVGKNVANRGFQSLEEHGFIFRRVNDKFEQKRLPIQWLLTELDNDHNGAKAAKDFMKWEAEN